MKINLTTSSTLGVESCLEEESKDGFVAATRRLRYRNDEKVTRVKSEASRSTLYAILHVCILFVIRWCLTVYVAVRRAYYHVYVRLNDRVNLDRVDGTFLSVPEHVSVILNDQCLTRRSILHDDDVVRKFSLIVDHLSKLGTRSVTFYQPPDVRSDVKSSGWLKDALLEKYSTGDLNNNNNNNNNNSECAKNGIRNGSFKSIHVSFVTNELAGKCLLVNACKRLAFKVKNKTLNASDVNQQLVDSQINESSNLKEPELVLTIGQQDTLAGFSPWHLRLSEIIKIPSIKLINDYTILDIIYKYNKIEKRFGK